MIPVIRCKPGFTMHPQPPPGGLRIVAAYDMLSKVIGRDVLFTAGTNDHTTGPHVRGEAIDASVSGWDVPTILKATRYLIQILGSRFTVLYEVPSAPSDPQLLPIAYVNGDATGPHVHVQVKKGTVFPPIELTDEMMTV